MLHDYELHDIFKYKTLNMMMKRITYKHNSAVTIDSI